MKKYICKYLFKPIWFHLVGIVFVFLQITGYLLARNETITWTPSRSLIIIVLSVVLGVIIGTCACGFCEKYFKAGLSIISYITEKEQYTCKKQKSTWKMAILCFLIIILCWLPLFIAYFPGIGSYDYGNQMISFMQGDVTTHHPVLHTEFMGKLWLWAFMEFGSGTMGLALYSVIQILFLALSFTYVVIVLHKLGMSDKSVIILAIIFGIFPLNGFMAISATKDSIFSGFFLILMVSLLYITVNNKKNWFEIVNVVVLSIAVFGTVAFRNNGRYAMIALLAGTLLVNVLEKFKNIRHIIVGILLVLAFSLSMGKMHSIEAEYYQPTKDQNEKYSVPFLQVTRTAAYHHGEMDEETLEYLEACFYEGFYNDYNPKLADQIKDSFDTKGYLNDERTLKTYLKIFKEYPGEYLNAFFALNAGYLYVFDTSCYTPYTEAEQKGLGYIITNENPVWMESIGVYKHSGLPWLYDWLEEVVSSNTLMKIPVLGQILAPAIWLYLYLFIIAACLTYRRFSHLIPLALVGGLYLTVLLGPVVLMRYVYPIMLCMMVYLLRYGELFFSRLKKQSY